MELSESASFAVEYICAGAHAHGFGRTAEGNPYAFRVRGRSLFVEVYRADSVAEVPDSDEVVAIAQRSVTEIDLTDERSIIAVVRDAVANADQLTDRPQRRFR